ncbi:MAG TPA: hypothetical protein VLM87_08465, partial [Rubrivivax sp.]|nr:hypothetical protein [Rubrivivax sp.]
TRALSSGLQCRPLEATLADTAAWAAEAAAAGSAGTTAGPQRPAVGLDAGREADLLAAWHAQAGSAGD